MRVGVAILDGLKLSYELDLVPSFDASGTL
jgi:hypothetical protein